MILFGPPACGEKKVTAQSSQLSRDGEKNTHFFLGGDHVCGLKTLMWVFFAPWVKLYIFISLLSSPPKTNQARIREARLLWPSSWS